MPTYFSYNEHIEPDILDIALYKGNAVPLEIHTTQDFTSDHVPVLLTINANPNTRPTSPRSYSVTNWAHFREYINDSLEGNVQISTKEELEAESEIFTNTLTAAIHTATKKIPLEKAPPLPLDIRTLIYEKKQARKMWQMTRNVIYKHEYNNLKNKVHRAVHNNTMDSLDKDIEDANKSSNIWKITRRLTKPRDGQTSQPIQTARGPAYDDDEKAEILADHFQQQFFPATEDPSLTSHYIEINKEVKRIYEKFISRSYSLYNSF